jgi:hypothetical protein
MCGQRRDEFFKIEDCPEYVQCDTCGTMKARKVIVVGHGGIFRDEPTWLDNSVREVLQDSDAIRAKKEKPIETRCDYNKWMQAHPNIQAS